MGMDEEEERIERHSENRITRLKDKFGVTG